MVEALSVALHSFLKYWYLRYALDRFNPSSRAGKIEKDRVLNVYRNCEIVSKKTFNALPAHKRHESLKSLSRLKLDQCKILIKRLLTLETTEAADIESTLEIVLPWPRDDDLFDLLNPKMCHACLTPDEREKHSITLLINGLLTEKVALGKDGVSAVSEMGLCSRSLRCRAVGAVRCGAVPCRGVCLSARLCE